MAQDNSKSELKLTKYNNILHTKIYRIEINDYQIVELIALKNGEYDGYLINCIWKINKNQNRTKSITQKIKIQNLTVKKLMAELENGKFETIPDCQDLKGCIEGLDGTTISFYVYKENISRNYSYWEPESDYYYKDKIIPEILQIREILKSINHEFDLRTSFAEFRDNLPKGKYTYGMVIIEKK
ncbi:hypothetical protein [uncultured Flavobacterium sp.]|uniref:hypothetical protein n=1 Tax=uncultured Flavobacterium sp. TaxID=165435 RepID=UPI0030819168